MRSRKIVAYDIETTGYSPRKNKILEIATATFVNGEIETWSTLILVDQIPKHISKITNITDKTIKTEGAVTLAEALEKFKEITKGALTVSHNGRAFDRKFLEANGVRLAQGWDTLLQTRCDISGRRGRSWRHSQDKAEKYRTKQKTNLLAAAKYYKIPVKGPQHRALPDALLCLEIFRKQVSKNKHRNILTID